MWACEGAMFPNACAQNGKMFCGGGGGGSGSAVVLSFLLICSWFFFFCFLSFLDAMLIGFLICFRVCCYAHGFFDVFVHLFRFRCYAH